MITLYVFLSIVIASAVTYAWGDRKYSAETFLIVLILWPALGVVFLIIAYAEWLATLKKRGW